MRQSGDTFLELTGAMFLVFGFFIDSFICFTIMTHLVVQVRLFYMINHPSRQTYVAIYFHFCNYFIWVVLYS